MPFPTPVSHLSYERWRALAGTDRFVPDASVIALHGDDVAGLTLTGLSGARNGLTIFTGTPRAWRGKGIAFALKVEALARAKKRGLHAMVTQNDEPNAPMRGINARLGYRPLPAEIVLEKPLG